MRRLYSLLAAICCCSMMLFAASGEKQVTDFGTGVKGMYPFFATSATYTYTQMVYTAEEIGLSATDLRSISFYHKQGNATYQKRVSIEICTTSLSDYNNNSFETSSATQVFVGELTIPSTEGWFEIPFTKAYQYNGTSNLAITVREITNTAASGDSHYFSMCDGAVGEQKLVYAKNSTTVLTRNNAESDGSPYYALNRPIIKFNYGYNDLTGHILSADQARVYPFTAAYKYSASQQLYTAAELGDMVGQKIKVLSLQQTNGNVLTRHLTIKMANTTKTGLASGFAPDSIMTTVYSGDITSASEAGWWDITLQQPFEYQMGKNMVIWVEDSTGTNVSAAYAPYFACDAKTSGMQWAWYNSTYSPIESRTNVRRDKHRNVIRLNNSTAPATGDTINYTYKGNTLWYRIESSTQVKLVSPEKTSATGQHRYGNRPLPTGHVYVPAFVRINNRNYTVRAAGTYALAYLTGITGLTFETATGVNGNLNFETGLCAGCTNLQSVSFERPITYLAERSFFDCSSLQNVEIANEDMDWYSLRTCWDGTPLVENLENDYFQFGTCAMRYKGTVQDSTITVREGITGVDYGFTYRVTGGYSTIGTIVLPSTLEYLKTYAFWYANNVSKIYCHATTPPDCGGSSGLALTSGPVMSGFNGKNLAPQLTVYVPWSADHSVLAAYQAADVWKDCMSIQEMPQMNSISRYPYYYEGDTLWYAFSDLANHIVHVSTPERSAGTDGSYYGTHQKPQGEVTVPEYIFINGYRCQVEGIANYAFKNVGTITKVNLPAGIKSIGTQAFRESSLTEINMPAALEICYMGAFYNCSSLNTVTMAAPDQHWREDFNTWVGAKVFTDVAAGQFGFGTYGLFWKGAVEDSTLTVPDGTTALGEGYAYHVEGNHGVKNVVIPSSMSYMQRVTMYTLGDVRKITSLATVPPTCEDATAFYSNTSTSTSYPDLRTVATLEVPYSADHSVLAAYQAAPVWSEFATIRELPRAEVGDTVPYFYMGDTLWYQLRTNHLAYAVRPTRTQNAAGNFYGTHTLPDGKVTIPETIRIGAETFTVVQLGQSLFDGISGVTEVVVPQTVSRMDWYVFRNTSLRKVNLPAATTYLGGYLFGNCNQLDTVVMEDLNCRWSEAWCTWHSSKPYSNLHNEFLTLGSNFAMRYKGTVGDTIFTVSEPIEALGDYCLYAMTDGSSITEIVLPQTLNMLKNRPFYNMISINKITCKATTPPSTTTVSFLTTDDASNANWRDLTQQATLYVRYKKDHSVKAAYQANARWGQFADIREYTEWGDTVPYYYMGDTLWYQLRDANNAYVVVPTKTLSNGHYYGTHTLPTGHVYVPDTMVTPDGKKVKVTIVGNYAFYGCTGVTEVTHGKHVFSTSYMAYGYSGVQRINFGQAFSSASNCAFSHADNLTELIFPEGKTGFGQTFNTWNYSTFYTALADQSYLTLLDGFAASYKGTIGSTTLTLPDNLKRLGNYLFYNATDAASVTRIDIPASVEQIDGYPFFNMTNVVNVRVYRTTPARIYSTSWWTRDSNTAANVDIRNQATLYVPWSADHSVLAAYQAAYYWRDFSSIREFCEDVTITAQASGNGTVSGGGTYAQGTTVTLTATPQTGYNFISWQDGNTQNPRQILAAEDATYTATFGTIGYTIVAQGDGHGTATGSGTYTYGQTVTLTAIPDEHYQFSRWSDYTSENPHTITVTEDATYTAEFMLKQYTVTDPEVEHCNIIGFGLYNALTTVSIEADPHWLYEFVSWSDGSTQNPRVFVLTQDTTLIPIVRKIHYTLTVTAGAHGTVTGSGSYETRTMATMAAYPEEGYEFDKWSDNDTANPRQVYMDEDKSFTATFRKIQCQIGATAAANGTVTGAGTYEWGSTVTLTATPNQYYQFSQWQDGNTENPRTFTANGNADYTATFSRIQYTVTASGQHGTVTGAGTYDAGTTATLTATPDQNYKFVKWSDNNTQNPRSFTVTQNKTLTAIFEKITYVITATAGEHGTVTGGGTYEIGAQVTLTATADPNYEFDHWQDGNTDNPRIVTANGNATYTASFKKIQYTITVSTTGEGTGTVTGAGQYDAGSTATLTATPAQYCSFGGWSDGSMENPRQIVVSGDMTISAIFTVDLYTITATADHGTVEGAGTFSGGTTVTLTATPDENYEFSRWSDGNTQNPRTITVTGDATYTAEFRLQQFTITATGEHGTVTGAGTYTYGETAILTATPDAGYIFKQWSDGNLENPRTITVTTNATYTAEFEELSALDDVDAQQKARKILIDGQVYIIRGDKTFDIFGTEVEM